MKKRHLKFDSFLAVATGVLLVLGILILASVSAGFSQERFGRTTYYLFHQILYGLIPGLILGFIALKIKISFFQKSAWVLILLTLISMVVVFIPGLGIISGGAPRWINLSFATFQPSEFLKLSFIIYLSAWLANRADRKTSLLLPFLAVLGVIVVLLGLQSDLGTLVVIIAAALLMFFLSDSSIWHNILLILICGGGLLALIKFAPYRMKRILVFLNPSLDPMGIGYQINQILIAIGSGGILGLGLGMSSQRFGFIPQTMADSIFAIFAEETGFIGSLILICLFLFFFWASLRIAKKSKDKFSKLLVMGISCWICIQAFVNVGAMIGLLPLTGIPLPFISYGGSHLVSELIGVGIILNISKSNKKW
jgi:cell division protein FtsW